MKVLILGGYSGIAQKVGELLAAEGSSLFLVGRNKEKLEIVAKHFEVLGAKNVWVEQADLNNLDNHKMIIEKAINTLMGLDLLLVCYGILPDQKKLEQNPEKILVNYYTNSISIIHFVSLIANFFESKNAGIIAVVTSVAGERGRKTNYFYGSAKACVDVFLDGLRHRLFRTNVKVVTIKPGIVDTAMTKDIENKILIAKPEVVATDIIRGIRNGKNIIYTPWYWKYIMAVLKILPNSLFNRLNI